MSQEQTPLMQFGPDAVDVAAALPPVQFGVIAPQPGDVIVIKTEEYLTQRQRDFLRDQVVSHLPAGVRAMVLEGGVELLLIKGAAKA